MPYDHLDGRIYHMTHIDNLHNILQQGALLSQKNLNQKRIRPFSIANQEVQRLRKRIYIWDSTEKQYRALHSYIPFYFARKTPMLYNQHNKGIQDKIIVFEVSRTFITDPHVLFTDGNASVQQLSKTGEETVRIIPATTADAMCHREYMPDGLALGTNQNCSNFYNDHTFLNRVNWDIIYRRRRLDLEEYKRVVHAEVLFPDQFPLDEVLCLSVSSKMTLQAVRDILEEEFMDIRLNLTNEDNE